MTIVTFLAACSFPASGAVPWISTSNTRGRRGAGLFPVLDRCLQTLLRSPERSADCLRGGEVPGEVLCQCCALLPLSRSSLCADPSHQYHTWTQLGGVLTYPRGVPPPSYTSSSFYLLGRTIRPLSLAALLLLLLLAPCLGHGGRSSSGCMAASHMLFHCPAVLVASPSNLSLTSSHPISLPLNHYFVILELPP